MGVLKILIILLMIFFPLGEVIRIQLSESVFLKPVDFIVGLTVALWLALIIKKNNFKIKENYLIKPIIIFVVISFISLLINSSLLKSSEFFTSFLYLVRWFVYAGIYFVICMFDKTFKKTILNAMVIAGGIAVLGGFIQYAFYQNLRNLYYLGWDEHMYRMFSSFLDPNFAGAFFVLYVLFLLGVFFTIEKKKQFFKKIIIVLLIILTTLAVFLTYSRSAYISLFVGISAFLILEKKIKWIFVLIAIFILIFILSSKNFYIENTNLFRTASSEARIQSAKEVIQIIKKHPLLGIGFNAYRYALIRYGFRTEVGAKVSHADGGTDNSFLFILATTGIVGFISYIFIFYLIFKKGLSAVVISSLTALFVNSLFINSLFFPPIMLWIWILIGLKDYT